MLFGLSRLCGEVDGGMVEQLTTATTIIEDSVVLDQALIVVNAYYNNMSKLLYCSLYF